MRVSEGVNVFYENEGNEGEEVGNKLRKGMGKEEKGRERDRKIE